MAYSIRVNKSWFEQLNENVHIDYQSQGVASVGLDKNGLEVLANGALAVAKHFGVPALRILQS